MLDYRRIAAWQKSMELVTEIYRLMRKLPKSESFGLASQMTRAAVSIPSNIAEGYRRGTKNEFHRFLSIASGSGAELETQLEIVKNIYSDKNLEIEKAESLLIEVTRLLNVMIKNPRVSFPD